MTELKRTYVHINESDRSLSLQTDIAPAPAAGEVLIEVKAAGINRADVLQRKGQYPPPEDASPIMGLEVSGTVVATGPEVDEWNEGEQLCALVHGGGYATHAIAPVSQCFPIPHGYTLEEAAALPEALLTVWNNVFQRAGLQPGQNVLLHGGASGVGTLGVSMCRAWGAQVFSTAGTDEKCRAVEELGAQRCVNYKTEDYLELLSGLGLRNKIDVILDMVGGDYIDRNISLAAPDGCIVNIAYQKGVKASVNFLPLMLKRVTLTGSTLRAQTASQKARMVVEIREQLFEHLDSGAVKPVLDQEFPLAECLQGQERMESGLHTGKILLIP
ncbi:MAG: NAD(P)H-quinone oxidoreductase [Pseudomonadota bacterium]